VYVSFLVHVTGYLILNGVVALVVYIVHSVLL